MTPCKETVTWKDYDMLRSGKWESSRVFVALAIEDLLNTKNRTKCDWYVLH